MDFGSVARARVNITNRQVAIAQQDLAAQQCSMPYRAPELFDVKTDSVLDEKVDIWSLGCTLYAMAYGQSPFEANMNEQGGSMALAVLNGQFRFPTDPQLERLYGQGLRDYISWMLSINPSQRPDIHQVFVLSYIIHWRSVSSFLTIFFQHRLLREPSNCCRMLAKPNNSL